MSTSNIEEFKRKIDDLKDEDGHQTMQSIKAIVDECEFGDWNINVRADDGRPYIQVTFIDKCEFSGTEELQSCRKWMLSFYMCDTEIVDTVYAAVVRAMQHEVNEKFKFMGKRIYNPHRDVYALVNISTSGNVDIRD